MNKMNKNGGGVGSNISSFHYIFIRWSRKKATRLYCSGGGWMRHIVSAGVIEGSPCCFATILLLCAPPNAISGLVLFIIFGGSF